MTHGIGFLPQCDHVVVMEGGRVTETGAYAELIDADGDFAEFIRTFVATDENEEGDPGMFASQFLNFTLNMYNIYVRM